VTLFTKIQVCSNFTFLMAFTSNLTTPVFSADNVSKQILLCCVHKYDYNIHNDLTKQACCHKTQPFQTAESCKCLLAININSQHDVCPTFCCFSIYEGLQNRDECPLQTLLATISGVNVTLLDIYALKSKQKVQKTAESEEF